MNVSFKEKCLVILSSTVSGKMPFFLLLLKWEICSGFRLRPRFK